VDEGDMIGSFLIGLIVGGFAWFIYGIHDTYWKGFDKIIIEQCDLKHSQIEEVDSIRVMKIYEYLDFLDKVGCRPTKPKENK
jgi:hypothetical protein